MFIKPFKVKSNNQLKGTERKKLCDEVNHAFPSLKTEDIQNLLPKKELVSVLKILSHNGTAGKVYCTGKVPLFFQFPSSPGLLPTVFTLWYFPELLYTFTTHSAVISKLSNGANLMLPGVITDAPVNFFSYGKLKKGTPVAVITEDNKAPVAVGVTAQSSEDMYMSAGFGICVDILHVIGDTLYNMDKPIIRPKLGPSTFFKSAIESYSDNNVLDKLSHNVENTNIREDKDFDCNDIIKNETEIKGMDKLSCRGDDDQVLDPGQGMDELLEYCFLKACKTSLKKENLPIITSTFFKNYVISVCPVGSTVDVKKSTYKKLSVFLSKMKEKGLLETSTLKGVESLLTVKFDHPLIKNLVIKEELTSEEKVVSNAPVISECFRVTTAVLPILRKFGYEKGDVMKRVEIRKCFTEYVKSENLQNGKILEINPQLAEVLHTKENQLNISMEDGINKFIGKMTHTHEITVGGTKLFHSGKLDPIDIMVATRSGNKKVTLINNLEKFGIKLDEFSRECQVIGASATITVVPGKKTPSVLVQGNQVLYVHKLLTEKYCINKNYIKGLEFAPKQRK